MEWILDYQRMKVLEGEGGLQVYQGVEYVQEVQVDQILLEGLEIGWEIGWEIGLEMVTSRQFVQRWIFQENQIALERQQGFFSGNP